MAGLREKEPDLTQHDLAKMLGVPNRTFDRYLSGKKEGGTPAQVVLRAQALLAKRRK